MSPSPDAIHDAYHYLAREHARLKEDTESLWREARELHGDCHVDPVWRRAHRRRLEAHLHALADHATKIRLTLDVIGALGTAADGDRAPSMNEAERRARPA